MSVFVGLASPEELARELVSFYNKLQFAVKQTESGDHDPKGAAEAEKEKDAAVEKEQREKKDTEHETPFLAHSLALVEKKAFAELLGSLVDLQNLVFEKAPERDIEGCLTLLCCLFRKLTEEAPTIQALITKLIANITSNVSDRPLLRLRLLSSIYNLLEPSSSARFEAFLALLKYADDSNNTETIIPQLPKIEGWLKQSGATADQKRSLYLLVRGIFLRTNQSTLAHEYLIKYLATFEEPTVESTAYAQVAAVEAIKLPAIVQCDHLLAIPAIQHLEQTHTLLYTLLKLFAEDSLEAFYKFHKVNGGFLASAGLVYEECLKKMRLLSLATLAAQHEEIPYSLIATTLSIDEAEVESWIITAIMTHILDAKMDQLRRVVVITRATQRVFTAKQWEQLGTQLDQWRENVKGLLQVVGQHSKAK